ncbi:MAG: hypothetical protein JXB32_12035 [Deltaproteobacteria bacterium]|nr:hypothetical protein [Deltaproteobacteria bacterium]
MTKRFRQLFVSLVIPAAFGAACDATPLPYPPDIQPTQLALTYEAPGTLELRGDPGAASPGGLALEVRNASRPTLPVAVVVAADGSFTAVLDGWLADTLRLTGTFAGDVTVLGHVASATAPGVETVPAPRDGDGDGWSAAHDCDDGAPSTFPGARELCDRRDNDCNGLIDEPPACAPCTSDADCANGRFCDGAELCSAGVCVPASAVLCDDGDPTTLDGCDPATDLCTHGPAPLPTCGNGLVEPGEACDDGNAVAGDGCDPDCGRCVPVAEVCNGLDDDCDGLVDDGLSCSLACVTDDDCDDGLFCTSVSSCMAGACVVLPDIVCDDGDPANTDICEEAADTCRHESCVPGPELCNGFDDDCDGSIDEDFDLATDPTNCGGCGNVCAAGETCTDGVCVA